MVIAISITCVICCRSLISSSPLHQHTPQHIRASPDSSTWDNIMPYFIAVMLLVGGIMLPSLASAIYFIMFLILGTMWACHKAIRLRRKKAFAYIRFALMVYSGIHVITFYLYQFQFFQSSLPPDSLLARWVLRSVICTCCAWNSLECCFHPQPRLQCRRPYNVLLACKIPAMNNNKQISLPTEREYM